MSAGIPNVKLNNGLEMPVFGLGIWQDSYGEETEIDQAVKDGIDLGYRLFDCTSFHANEKLIGKAFQEKLQQGVIKRKDLFLVSKLYCNSNSTDLIESALSNTLKNLQTTYLDLYFIDFQKTDDLINLENPSTEHIISSAAGYIDMWKAVEAIYKKQLTRTIGLLNFSSEQIDKILKICTVMPQVIQVECHPLLNQRKLRKYCESNGLVITSSTPFGGSGVGAADILTDPRIKEIANRYRKTPDQILLKYNIQLGNVVILKYSNKNKLLENMQIFDFYLAHEDMSYINSFN